MVYPNIGSSRAAVIVMPRSKDEKKEASPCQLKKIFLSWSGKNEKEIALHIKAMLETYYEVSVFVSDEDIGGQERGWRDSIIENIKKSGYGVVCISPLNRNRPWLLYEAGALEGHLKFKNVSILSLGLPHDLVPSPLKGKQVRVLDKKGYEAFLNDFTKGIKGLTIRKKFTESSWKSFSKKIKPYLDSIKNEYETLNSEEEVSVSGENSLQGGLRVEAGTVTRNYEQGKSIVGGMLKWHVAFEVPFNDVPKVICSINLSDCTSLAFAVKESEKARGISAATSRVKVETQNVTRTGFDISAGTWTKHNLLHGIGVSWLAIGQGKQA